MQARSRADSLAGLVNDDRAARNAARPKDGPRADPRRKKKKPSRRKEALAPLQHRSRLDLSAPSDQPLTEEEVAEAVQHLALLKRFKKALRLSLNATEDLLVNGAKPPEDRGVMKHLLAKVDRQVVQAALSREPLMSDRGLRSVFLGGIVRLRPSFDNLIAYVETIADGDRRAAAEAFGLTVRKLPFAEASAAQLDGLLAMLAETFDGHDHTQAVLGLLDQAYEAIEGSHSEISAERGAALAPLMAAHAAVVGSRPLPESEDGRALVAEGLALWLAAPPNVLRSYPEKLRWRLAEYAVRAAREVLPDTVPPSLFTSLPADDKRYGPLVLLRAEALAKAGEVDAARALLRPVADRPQATAPVKTLARVLAWPRLGQATIDPQPGPGRLRRAFELSLGAHGWARTAPADSAGALIAEARRQADLLVPGVAIVLGQGLAKDGSAYVVVGGRGRPWTANPTAPVPELLQQILDATLIAQAVSGIGLTLPDFEPTRFLVHGRPGRLTPRRPQRRRRLGAHASGLDPRSANPGAGPLDGPGRRRSAAVRPSPGGGRPTRGPHPGSAVDQGAGHRPWPQRYAEDLRGPPALGIEASRHRAPRRRRRWQEEERAAAGQRQAGFERRQARAVVLVLTVDALIIMVDWSAASSLRPVRPSADACWVAYGWAGTPRAERPPPEYFRSRSDCLARLKSLLVGHSGPALMGVDFGLGYPLGRDGEPRLPVFPTPLDA